MTDLQTRFAEAQRALENGAYDQCLAILDTLIQAAPEQPAFYHLSGVALKKNGQLDRARIALERGIAVRGDIPALHGEYASLLDDMGEGKAAIAAYDRAIELAPNLLDARIDRALARYKHSDALAGLEELLALAEEFPDNPRIWLNIGITARALSRLKEADGAIDKALELAPGAPKALRLRAQQSLDFGRPAVHLFEDASKAEPDNRENWSGYASALLAEGKAEDAIDFLAAKTESEPQWYQGLHDLAEMRWQIGDPDGFVDGYRKSLESHTDDPRLWMDLIVATARGLGHDQALPLYEKARQAAGEDLRFDNLEANSLTELDELDRARPIYEKLADQSDSFFRLPLTRFFLRTREFDRAEATAQELVDRGEAAEAWPYLSIAWRMQGDPRWAWLEGERDLPRIFDLDAFKPELEALAERLRSLHKWQTHPFEQSLRGGTQTDNILFSREDPEIVSLVRHIRGAVRNYMDDLPVEENHPVLSKPRGDFRFTGSWSVRLTDAGFHVNHIHNQGWISSAMYIAVPDSIGSSEAAQDGWLALGEPPSEFGLNVSPIKLVKPEPGRLVLFPSIMWHGTRPFSAGERMTVAFDVAPI